MVRDDEHNQFSSITLSSPSLARSLSLCSYSFCRLLRILMEVAAESALFNPSTFFPRSNPSFLPASHPQIRLPTTNFPTNLHLFSSRFQQNQGFVCRFQQSEVHGTENSITSLKLGFFVNQRTIVLAATVVRVLVFGCRGVFAVEGVVDSGYGVIGQNILLLKSYWPKLSQVLGVFNEQGLVLAALLGLSAFFSMAETSITTLWPWKVRELAEKESEDAVVNIGATAPVTKAATTIFGEAGVSAATGVMTVAALLLTEITPKSIAVHNVTEVARFVVRPVAWLSLILYPVGRVVRMLKMLGLKGRRYYINNSVNSTLTNFETMRLASCNLSEFPNFLREQAILRFLDLSNNKIHGEFPKWLFNVGRDSLHNLNLSHNFLTSLERLPWKNLGYIDLHSNLLRGPLHVPLNTTYAFSILNNKLTGEIPTLICNLSSLGILDLSNNNLSGFILQCLGNSSNSLSVPALRFNMFHGPIGTFKTKGKHPFLKLRIIDISYNEFTGLLPTNYIKQFEATMNADEHEMKLKYMGEYYYQDSVVVMMKGYEIEYSRILTVFSITDSSRNKFQRDIPKSIGRLNSLWGFNLSHNNLKGHIPTLLGNLTNLESLDLSSNELVGEIPQQLTSLKFLAVLNFSDNQLAGQIPQGSQFNTFGNDSYNGNLALCGFSLSKKCEEQQPLPPSLTLQHDENSDWEICCTERSRIPSELRLQINVGISPVNLLFEIEKTYVVLGGTGSGPWCKLECRSIYLKFFHGRRSKLV
ncbi:unnamed protein product [Camellia sinensis]